MVQRLGWIHLISKKRENIRRIWLHALSVGEVKSALPLVNALKKRSLSPLPDHSHNNQPHNLVNHQADYELIITASTRTGFAVAQELFTGTASLSIQIGYFPFDLPFSVKSVCSRVAPDIVIIMESDLWPGFLWHMRNKKVPVFLVNARLSKSSFNGYIAFRKIFASVFSLFETIMVQTELDRARFMKIGVDDKKVVVTGNIKFDQPLPKAESLDGLKLHFADPFSSSCPVRYILAGSTHKGEEEILLSVFRQLKEDPVFNHIKLIIAPRDPKRATSIRTMVMAQDDGDSITKELIIIDRMGVLAALYSICDIAFVGGSLLPFGGHNPLEPALFSKPVIFGTHMEDFKEVSETMLENGAAFMVSGRDELLETLTMLLYDRELAQRAGKSAGILVENGRGVVEKILSVIQNSSASLRSIGKSR